MNANALPPMHTLRAYEALVRLRSFAAAAAELSLSPSAISHQIRSLESFYGVRLIVRAREGVSPTRQGMQLLDVVRAFLSQLSKVGADIQASGSNKLSLTLPPSLAARWLMPRLAQYLRDKPHLDFHLHATTDLVDLDADRVDVAIRYGKGQWTALDAEPLLSETIYPVASPDYLERATAPFVLLQDSFMSWDHWFDQIGETPWPSRPGPVFSDSALLLQAAERGAGIALGRSVLVADSLESGALIRADRREVSAPGSYWLVRREGIEQSGATAEFCSWVCTFATAAKAQAFPPGRHHAKRTTSSR